MKEQEKIKEVLHPLGERLVDFYDDKIIAALVEISRFLSRFALFVIISD